MDQNITRSTHKCMIKNISLWTLVSANHDCFVSTTYYVSDVSIFKLEYIDYHYCKKGVQQKDTFSNLSSISCKPRRKITRLEL